MIRRSFGSTFALALTAGISVQSFPVAAQSPLGKAMGEKWAKSCLTESAKTAYRQQLQRAPVPTTLVEATTACCRRERNNDGKVPLKVVILDMGKYDIGRTPDYELGSMPPITLKQKVAKYHWEVFAPGAKEPCQVGHDETRSSITVHCKP